MVNKFMVVSRIALIAVSVYEIYSICELLKPQMENNTQYIGTFIFLLVLAFSSIIDWNIKAAASGGRSKRQ